MSSRAVKSLYLGLRPQLNCDHYPVISIKPLVALPLENFYSHILFTSQTAVSLFPYSNTPVIAVGRATAASALAAGYHVSHIAKEETAEGVVDLLTPCFQKSYLLWPRSTKARPVIAEHCRKNKIALFEHPLYSVELICPTPRPNLLDYRDIIFTSPSTVEGFFRIFSTLPDHLSVACIGPITYRYLMQRANIAPERVSLHRLSKYT